MTQVKAIQCKITDEYGIPSNDAIAYVIDFCATSSARGKAEKVGDEFKVTNDFEGIAYSVMYWHSVETKESGYKAKLLRVDDGGDGFTDAIPVNMDRQELNAIFASSLPHDDKVARIIEEDLKRRY